MCLSCLWSRVGATCHRVIARRWKSATSHCRRRRSTRRRTFAPRLTVYPSDHVQCSRRATPADDSIPTSCQTYTEQCYNYPRQSSPPSHPSSTTTTVASLRWGGRKLFQAKFSTTNLAQEAQHVLGAIALTRVATHPPPLRVIATFHSNGVAVEGSIGYRGTVLGWPVKCRCFVLGYTL